MKVTVARDAKCGYRVLANEDAGRLVQLPKLSQIEVGCGALTKPTDVAAFLHAVSPPDDAQQSTCNLIAYPVPVIVGTAVDGSHWSIHIPQTGCAAPKIWSLLLRIQHTGHI